MAKEGVNKLLDSMMMYDVIGTSKKIRGYMFASGQGSEALPLIPKISLGPDESMVDRILFLSKLIKGNIYFDVNGITVVFVKEENKFDIHKVSSIHPEKESQDSLLLKLNNLLEEHQEKRRDKSIIEMIRIFLSSLRKKQ